ncbi:carbohydrate ABC transporter permease [Cryptosporangium sp. NPDC048952]|uniref:carbohydrate ABC transporter permease n=1 Tax=Cryptosporangium sp. NPDC048952 TaxID=3363961 RepID=UPI00371D7BD1
MLPSRPATGGTPAAARSKKPTSELARRRQRLGWLYSAPMALVVVVFFVLPLALMFWMSFNHWPLLGASAPNGVENYRALSDPLFVRALWFTVKYAVVTTVVLSLVAFGMALLVQEIRPGVGFFRTIYFLPAAVGLGSASLLFYGLYNTGDSPLNTTLDAIGIGPVDWLGTNNSALLSTIGMITWRFAGFYMLILLTGLHSISPMLYEAARTDGASRWQTMRHVTLPLLRPTLALMLVLSVTGSLLAFEQFFIMTGGRHDTTTLAVDIYREAFLSQDLGRAAAVSVALLLVLILINGAQLRLLRRKDSS